MRHEGWLATDIAPCHSVMPRAHYLTEMYNTWNTRHRHSSTQRTEHASIQPDDTNVHKYRLGGYNWNVNAAQSILEKPYAVLQYLLLRSNVYRQQCGRSKWNLNSIIRGIYHILYLVDEVVYGIRYINMSTNTVEMLQMHSVDGSEKNRTTLEHMLRVNIVFIDNNSLKDLIHQQ